MKYYVSLNQDRDVIGIVKANNKADAWKKVAKAHGDSLATLKYHISLEKTELY